MAGAYELRITGNHPPSSSHRPSPFLLKFSAADIEVQAETARWNGPRYSAEDAYGPRRWFFETAMGELSICIKQQSVLCPVEEL